MSTLSLDPRIQGGRVTLTLYLVHSTDKATLFMFIPKQSWDMKADTKIGVWLPRARFKILERGLRLDGQWGKCVVSIEHWLGKDLIDRQERIRQLYGITL